MNKTPTGPDPIVTEIVRNGMIAITEEMKSNLMRTAYNMIIYEALDFTVGLFTEKGETISIGLGLPMFIRGMAETIKAKLEHYGAENINPGDILLTNDAYITGSHLNHLTFSMPIFLEDELIGFACCMAHWPDIGGTLDGITTDIYSEGLQIPIVKYQREGVVNEEIVDIIRANVRLPDRAMGDLRAQLTAITTGERRYLELVKRYGRAQVAASISDIMDQSERAARARTLSIPDGVYEAESYMDDDGVSISDRIPIRVRVIVDGDEMTVDLSDVAAQVQGFYNSGITTGHACSQVAFKCITSPTDYPINDGSFRNLKAVVPPGRVVSAVKPAPMRWWMTFPMTIVDTVFKALTPAIPERTIAGHHADLVIGMLNGINPKNNEFYIAFIGPTGGGWGAKQNEDGVSATVCINDGDTHNSPAEQLESKYPFLIENYALREDSGGAGEYRGGLGCENTVQARADFMLNAQVERMHCKPWGLNGGKEAAGNAVVLRADGTWKEDYPNAKLLTARIKQGDAFAVRSGGGGGFGDPRKRPAETVANDVRQGYVSVESARKDYAVVCDARGNLDAAATEKLRAEN
ncbi:MAG: hydantoinase B/oxoprolinase family protein [Rhodospirillaceae bacterium TMED63]|nr:5-oxoprolinase [Rhodospirillaceae bacterium]RPF95750.1 MAG: hydantoinase B/oxoprolinase family protein [Rhodospirillaceae bacterium TMED63]